MTSSEQKRWIRPWLEATSFAAPDLPAFSNSTHRWTSREGVLLRLRDSEGNEGVGELAPLPGFSPELLPQALEALDDALLLCRLDRLRQKTPDTEWFAQLRADVVAPLIGRRLPSVAFALETALVHYWSKREGRGPLQWLARHLNRTPSTIVPLSRVMDAQAFEPARTRLREGWALGIRSFKLKVGRPGRLREEGALVADLLAELPNEGRLRLDANGQLPPLEVASWLAEVRERAERLGKGSCLEAIEEPCPLPVLHTLPPLPVPVWLDESLVSPDSSGPDPGERAGLACLERERDVDALIRSGRVGGLVLKLGLVGGLLAGLSWADLARRHGAVVSVSHLLEGPVAHRAACTLALLLGGSVASGLEGHALLTRAQEWPIPELRPACLVALEGDIVN